MTIEELENCWQRLRNVCITNYPSFDRVCLDLEVLQTALVAMREVRVEDSSTRSSATFRLAAYRQSTWWIHTQAIRYLKLNVLRAYPYPFFNHT